MERRTASSLVPGAVVSVAILFLAYGGAAGQSRQNVPDRPADTSVKIETLSATQRSTMPGSTNVILPGGRTVSLADLRQEHAARLARFAKPQSPTETYAGSPPATTKVSQIPPGFKLLPMKLPLGVAVDYKSICGQPKVSGCLYFPGGTILQRFSALQAKYGPNLVYDYDPLIEDEKVCTSQGGSLVGVGNFGGGLVIHMGCAYGYPLAYFANFNPGPPPSGQTVGSNIVVEKSCDPGASVVFDPHGAIKLTSTFWKEPVSKTTLSVKCRISVYAPPQ